MVYLAEMGFSGASTSRHHKYAVLLVYNAVNSILLLCRQQVIRNCSDVRMHVLDELPCCILHVPDGDISRLHMKRMVQLKALHEFCCCTGIQHVTVGISVQHAFHRSISGEDATVLAFYEV